MHVVLTGAAGFIGSHTSERLVAAGHYVTGVDCFDATLYPAEVKRATAAELSGKLPANQFALFEADICDREAMAGVLDGQRGVDVVCHLAAVAGVRPSLTDPARYCRVNVEGTTNLLELSRRAGIDRFVFASSSSVYGAREPAVGDSVAAFREDDPCLHPASPYAATKRAGELITSTFRDLYGIGISCLRYFTVYGPRQRHDMAIHKFTEAIARGRPITLFGDGTSRRDYTFIEDIVSGTCAAIERTMPGQHEVYNLGGTATTSLAELVSLIENAVGKRAVVDRQPDQPGDVPITFASVDRAARDLDYRPTTPIAAGIDRFWEWLKPRL